MSKVLLEDRIYRMNKEALRQKAQQLPLLPGVYFMEDSLGNIIYIGKSKALKNRVSSYFSGGKKTSKVERMVRCIDSFKVQYTDTELEALILECQLIKAHKPIYNRLLKQDHKYRYFYLNPHHQRPRIRLVREKGEEGYYFGPYEKGQSLYLAMQAVNEYYQLPDCGREEIKENCLTYKRGKCIGPCKMPYDEEQLKEKLNGAIKFLKGKDSRIINDYKEQMEEASYNLDFEEALKCKEIWLGLKALQFRKEAMSFALSPTISLLEEVCPAGGKKLFLWLGTRLLWSEKIKENLRAKDKQKIEKSMLKAYGAGRLLPEKELTKEKIDEAQIIYSWLGKKTDEVCEHFMIGEEEDDKILLRNKLKKLLN